MFTEVLHADGRIDRAEADSLVELHARAERVTPGFEKVFRKAIEAHGPANGATPPRRPTG